jgi:hypothetical protein
LSFLDHKNTQNKSSDIKEKKEGDSVPGDDKPKHNTGVLSICFGAIGMQFHYTLPIFCVIRSSDYRLCF